MLNSNSTFESLDNKPQESMLKKIYKFLSPKHPTLFLDYHVDMKPRYGHGKPAHKELLKIVNQNRGLYASFLRESLNYKENIQTIKKQSEENNVNNPAWNNGFLPGLDIISIYTMIAINKPKKYIEVGSGNSTKVVHKARTENNLVTEIVSIDPFPRTEIDHIVDKVIREPFETVDYNAILNLGENDILFIDNSHRILPNSDSMVFYMEILSQLKKGVIVHVHDIYIPYDYPQFMCDRFYSEQYGLAAFLLANPKKYQTILPNYFIAEDPELSKIIEPFWDHPNTQNVEKHGGSFWLRIAE